MLHNGEVAMYGTKYRFWSNVFMKYFDVASINFKDRIVTNYQGFSHHMDDGELEPNVGLLDRDGNEVYIGDVLAEYKNGWVSICVVKRHEYDFYAEYLVNRDPRRKKENRPMFFKSFMENFRKIGNIHEYNKGGDVV